ncbi:MAG TPA: phosphoribosyltransferase family protein [Gaiellaceae bacterium]|nr:phosphoribosyltransferase family protein [Gaiellaceae bacterium]
MLRRSRGNTVRVSIRIVDWFPPLFHDREEAGRTLAAAVPEPEPGPQPLVVALARGGVAVAVEVARRLDAPLTAAAVARVDARGLRLGATTAEGPPFLLDGHGVPGEEVAALVERARREAAALERRLELRRPPLAGRHAVVVDDGLVTGLTLAAGCRWASAAGAARVTAATPVGAPRGLARVAAEGADVVCPHVLEQLAVVGQAYELFDPLDEWYVAGLLGRA